MSTYSNFENDKDYKREKERRAREKFKPIKNNIFIVSGIMALSFLLGFLSFIFVYWCLSVIDIHYALKSLIAFLAAYFSLLLITPDTDFKKRLREASRPFVFMVTFLSLIMGFNKYGAGPLDKYLKEPKKDTSTIVVDTVTLIDFGTLKHKGETWTSYHFFKAGTWVNLEIRGASVKLYGEKFLPNDYTIKTKKDGQLTFVATTNITTTIEVIP